MMKDGNIDPETIEFKQEMMSDEEEIDGGSYEEEIEHQQTDPGLLTSFSLLEKSFMTQEVKVLLSREEVETAKRNKDPDLSFER